MKSNASLLYSVILLLGDFLALVLAFVGAYILRVTFGLGLDTETISVAVPAITYLGIFISLVPFWIIMFAMLGLYNNSIYEKRFIEVGRLLVGSFMGLLFVLGYAFVSNDPVFPAKLVPFYGFILAFFFLLLLRNLARFGRSKLFEYNIGLTNILIIGDTKISEELLSELTHQSSGYRVIGLVSVKQQDNELHAKVPNFKDFESATEKLGTENIHSIVQTELYANSNKNNEVLDYAQKHHIAFRFIPGNTELFVGNIQVELFRNSLPVIAVHQTALIGWGRILKRLFDLVVASTLFLITLPLTLVICALQLLSGGDVFFRQKRLTRFNHTFDVYKFRTVRTMYNGLPPEDAFAKMGKPELAETYRANGDMLLNDPRYGRLGNFLRKTSLDELPQLLNVIKGDISLVGPRALVPEELSVYEKRHAILSVKSGLTGLAQVSGRGAISFDERRKLDMYYVQNWSFWLDIVILLKTIRVVLTGSGAR